MTQLAVVLKFAGAEINAAVQRVGIARIHNLLYQRDDLRNGFGRLGMHRGRADAQTFGVGPEFVDIALRHRFIVGSFFVCLVNDFVVNVSKVLDKAHVVAFVFQVTAQHVKNAERARIANMDVVIDGWAAGVHPDLSGLNGAKLLFFSGKGVKNLHLPCLLPANYIN